MLTTFSRKQSCHYCNKELTRNQSLAGNICNDVQCRLAWQRDKLKPEQQRLKKKLEMDIAFEAKAHIHHEQLTAITGDEDLASATVEEAA